MAGLPVYAEHLTLSPCRLFTGMRTSDDLTHGISYFNAELLRLKQLIGVLDDTPTLVILDEILRGTNSKDKLHGSQIFLEYLSQHNVTAIIMATASTTIASRSLSASRSPTTIASRPASPKIRMPPIY